MNRNDDSTHDTVFQTRSSNTLILRVHLSTQNKAPEMILVGAKVSHPWVDLKYRITGFPQIASDRAWEESGMKLGDAVSQVVLHLQLNPPTVIEITDQFLKKMQPANSVVTNTSGQGPPSYDSVSDPDPEIEFDFEIPTSFPTLDALSKDEISHLLTDNDVFDEFASILPSKSAILEFKSDLQNENITKAKDIVTHKDELEFMFKEVESLSTEFQNNMEKYKELKSKQHELKRPMDVRDVTKKLTIAKKEAFEESEEVASCWVDDTSEMPINIFVQEFLEKRNIFHERAAKIEMLTSNNR